MEVLPGTTKIRWPSRVASVRGVRQTGRQPRSRSAPLSMALPCRSFAAHASSATEKLELLRTFDELLHRHAHLSHTVENGTPLALANVFDIRLVNAVMRRYEFHRFHALRALCHLVVHEFFHLRRGARFDAHVDADRPRQEILSSVQTGFA